MRRGPLLIGRFGKSLTMGGRSCPRQAALVQGFNALLCFFDLRSEILEFGEQGSDFVHVEQIGSGEVPASAPPVHPL